MTSIPTRRYRHYKGNEYTVLGVTRHSESLEELVLYRQEYGDHGLWVRPKEMFSETVTVDGQDVPRFQYLGEEPAKQAYAGNLFSNIPSSLPQELIQTLRFRRPYYLSQRVPDARKSPWFPGAFALTTLGECFDQTQISRISGGISGGTWQ